MTGLGCRGWAVSALCLVPCRVWVVFVAASCCRCLPGTVSFAGRSQGSLSDDRARACLQAALPNFAGVAALKRVAQDPSVVRNKRALALHGLGQCAPTDDMVRAPKRSAP